MNHLKLTAASLPLGLLLSLGSAAAAQAQTSTSNPNAATVAFQAPPVTINAGESVTIPLVLDTHGKAIDGLQIEWTLSGVTISDVQLVVPPELPLNQLKVQATPEGGALSLVPQNPTQPFSSDTPVTIANLTYTPQSEGTLVIKYNLDNTVIASSETNTNVAAPPVDQNVEVMPSIATTQGTNATPVGDSSLPNLMGRQLGIGLGFAAIVLVLFVIMFLRKLRAPRAVTTTTSTAPVVPSAEVFPVPENLQAKTPPATPAPVAPAAGMPPVTGAVVPPIPTLRANAAAGMQAPSPTAPSATPDPTVITPPPTTTQSQ